LTDRPPEEWGKGFTGNKNMGSFSTRPYNSSKNVLMGLLALKVPVTNGYDFDCCKNE